MFVNISDIRPITASAFRWRLCRLSRAVFALLRPPLLRRPPFSGGRGRPPRTATALRPRTGLNVRAIFFENPNHQRQVTTSITKSFSQNLDHDRRGFPPRLQPGQTHPAKHINVPTSHGLELLGAYASHRHFFGVSSSWLLVAPLVLRRALQASPPSPSNLAARLQRGQTRCFRSACLAAQRTTTPSLHSTRTAVSPLGGKAPPILGLLGRLNRRRGKWAKHGHVGSPPVWSAPFEPMRHCFNQ